MQRILTLLVLPLFVALAAACAGSDLKTGSLYQRLGGEQGVGRIVDDLIVNVQRDPRIRDRFENADLPRLKRLLAEQVCAIGGGPCVYEGRGMAEAHRGMKIGNIEFDAFIGDFAKALDQNDVAPREQRELLFALKAMQAEVMGLDDG